MPIVNKRTKKIVRIGDKFTLPGGMEVKVTGFNSGCVVVENDGDYNAEFTFAHLGLEAIARIEPSLLMTSDDWIHATNNAKETGGHFLGHLARAYQHADTGNVKPIKANYHSHFFRFLDRERQLELQREASQD